MHPNEYQYHERQDFLPAKKPEVLEPLSLIRADSFGSEGIIVK